MSSLPSLELTYSSEPRVYYSEHENPYQYHCPSLACTLGIQAPLFPCDVFPGKDPTLAKSLAYSMMMPMELNRAYESKTMLTVFM